MANTYKFLDKNGLGYFWSLLKANFKNEAEINALISAALNQYKQDVITVTTQLPTVGVEGILYLVPTTDNPLLFDSYIWELKDGSTTEYGFRQWTRGEAKIDMSEYYKKTEIDANFYNKTEMDDLLDAKVNTADMQTITNDEIDAIMV